MELDKFKLESLDTAIVAILLLVPGFVMRAVTGQALDRKRAEAELQLVELVVRSLLCDAVLLAGLMLLGVIRSNKDIEDLSAATLGHLGVLLLGVFVVPILLGCVEAVLIARWRPGEYLLNRLGLPLRMEERSAWDKLFMGLFNSGDGYRLVEITTDDHAKVFGALDAGSYASGVLGERDIYIARVYDQLPDGTFELRKGSDGILIKAHDIRRIELLYPDAVDPLDDVN